ncbi:hypothetical protein KP509_04G087900 [Ceratopteris richardii]|uniref:LHY n=1 Tax=Ceratopteris richardii TaxID=49495 RepID=A0A8T2V1F1_CERRI|nr:hypothetical protein KP509_04G087900 [Ceratopteris richardii]
MSAAPEIINPQNVADIEKSWKAIPFFEKQTGTGCNFNKLSNGDVSSSNDEFGTKVRKPYTITKQRERWTESEHEKFLEALKLYGRAWRRIEEYIGTKTAVQIRSHAQKFFCKLEREASTGSSDGKALDIVIPPPRPKKKPKHPYPKKAGNSMCNPEDESKEISLMSFPEQTAANNIEGFQSGSLNCMNQGQGLSAEDFGQRPASDGHFITSQGSVKIFGKTVPVLQIDNQVSHKNASKEESFRKDNVAILKKSHVGGWMENSCCLSEVHPHLDGDGPSPGAFRSGDTDPSLEQTSGYEFAVSDAGAVDIPTKNEACKDTSITSLTNTQNSDSAVGRKVTDVTHMQFYRDMNSEIQKWMDNIIHSQSKISFPSISANAIADGASNPLSYWQFMQASAVQYAACTAAMAAAAAAGWKASNPGGIESSSHMNCKTAETAMPSTPSALWSFRGFIPAMYFPPVGVLSQGEKILTALENEKERDLLERTLALGDQSNEYSNLTKESDAKKSNIKTYDENGSNDQTKVNFTMQINKELEGSCLTETHVSLKGLPDSESLQIQNMANTIISGKHVNNTDTITVFKAPHNTYSSCDEFDERNSKEEGSSSGSNTPRCQSTEFDMMTTVEAAKGDGYHFSEDHAESCNEVFQNPVVQCTTNSMINLLPKLRLKCTEKSRKHVRRDIRYHGNVTLKRLKSSAHEGEQRKEVSEEGRKAFQALFSSKLLPQTFRNASADTPVKDTDRSCEFNEACLVQLARSSNSNSFKVSSSSGFVPYRRPS